MGKVFWLMVGVGVGFVVAHQVNKTPEGRKFFEDVDSKAREFADAVVEGYRAREAELRGELDDDFAAKAG